MIVQRLGGRLRLIRQTDHALLSGAFADAWGSEALPPPPRPGPTVAAAARHDDGWADWELAPTVDDDGHPVDFIHVPRDEHVALYRRGIDLVCEEDPFAGLVVSMHGERLYTRPFVAGGEPMIDRLEGADRTLADGYVAGERERQGRLLAGLDRDAEADAGEAWRLIQVWDRLSLFVCMAPLEAGNTWTMPPVRGTSGDDVEIAAAAEDGETVSLDPYPLRASPLHVEVEAFELGAERFEDDTAFRRAFRTAPRTVLGFIFTSA